MKDFISDAEMAELEGKGTPDFISDADMVAMEKRGQDGGLVASAKQAIGATIKGAGQAAADFIPGIGEDNAVKRYGQSVIDANPTSVHSLSDIADRPGKAVAEATGNAAGSMGAMLGARAVGQGITAAAPLTGPAAPVVALAGQAISWLGPAAVAALPSFGSIRDKQILKDPEAEASAKDKAIAALGAATVGVIESKFGPQEWALSAMTKEGRAALAEKFVAATLTGSVAKGVVKGAAIEGAEELVQNPIEQLASGDNPTTAESLKETAFGGVMGAIGGGVLGGGVGAAFRQSPKTEQDVLQSGSVDEAISNFSEAIDQTLETASVQAERDRLAAVDAADFADLRKSEEADLAYRRRDSVDRAATARDYDAALAQAEERQQASREADIPRMLDQRDQQMGLTRPQLEAASEAAGVNQGGETAMQLAFQRALQRATPQPAAAAEVQPITQEQGNEKGQGQGGRRQEVLTAAGEQSPAPITQGAENGAQPQRADAAVAAPGTQVPAPGGSPAAADVAQVAQPVGVEAAPVRVAGSQDVAGGQDASTLPVRMEPASDARPAVGDARQNAAQPENPPAPVQAAETSFEPRPDGTIRVKGYPADQVRAAAKSLKVNAIVGNNGNAVFAKGTDLSKLKAQLGAVEAKAPRAARQEALTEEQVAYRADIRTRANEYGVRTVGRQFSDVEAEVLQIAEQRLQDEIAQAGETVESLRREAAKWGIDEQTVAAVESEVSAENQSILQLHRAISLRLEEIINDRIQQEADAEASRTDGEGGGTRSPEAEVGTEAQAETQGRAEGLAEAQRLKEEPATDQKRQADAERQPEDQVAKAKATLDAAGITGTDRTTTIAAVRRGDLTAEDVAEAHPAKEGAAKEPWQMSKAEFRDNDQALLDAKNARDEAQSAVGGGKGTAWGDTTRYSGAMAGNRLAAADKARERWSKAFDKAESRHKAAIKKALAEGRDVPAEVMAEYPDLTQESPQGKEGAGTLPDAAGRTLESRSGYTREAFAANAMQELASQDELFRYPVSKAATLKGVMKDVFPGAIYFGETSRADEKAESGADQRFTFQTPSTTAGKDRTERIGKRFDVYVSGNRVWVDLSRLEPGDQGSRIYAAVANYAYNARKVFSGDPAGVSVPAIIARTKMMLSSALRFGTTRHLDASIEQERGIPDKGLPPLDWRGNDIDKVRALIHTFLETVQTNAPDIKNFRYDFEKLRFVDTRTGQEFRPSLAGFDAALGTDQRSAAGIGKDSGRAAIVIQSLVSGESGTPGDAGILQAILDYSGALVKDGGLEGMLSKAPERGLSLSEDRRTEAYKAVKAAVEDFKKTLPGAAALDFHVASTAFDIPERYRPSPFAEGVYHSDAGLVYLVTMNLRNERGELDLNRVNQVLLHESVGHYGLMTMMGDDFKPILGDVFRLARAKGDVSKVRAGDADYATVEAVQRAYPEASDDMVAMEVLARMAETGTGNKSLMQITLARIRQWLRKVAKQLGLDIDFTMDDARDLVMLAAEYLRRGDNLDASAAGEMALASQAAESRAATMPASGQVSNPGLSVSGITSSWQSEPVTAWDDFVRKMQDKLVDTKRVVQAIREAGIKIRDEFDPYLQETLYHGRAAKRVADFSDAELKPLLVEMQARGISMQELDDYLWARHAAERNAQVAKINPDMPDGGSGLTNQEAADVLAGKAVKVGDRTIQIDPKRMSGYESLAKRVDAITKGTTDMLVAYGLETRETVDAWRGAYQNYVPLMRDMDEIDIGLGTGQGFSVRGAASRRAMGSERAVVDILANVAMQRERAITRGEKNRVAQAVLGLALTAENKDFWTVDTAPKERVVENVAVYRVLDRAGAELGNFTRMDEAERLAKQNPGSTISQTWEDRVTERIPPTFRSQDNVLLARVNGEDHFVIFDENDARAQRMVASLKNLDAEQLSWAMQHVATATRYFASINTQYNPVFGIVNGMRDLGSAMLNLSSTAIRGKQKDVARNAMSALAGIYIDLRDHRKGIAPTSQWAQLYEEFQKEGGQTGYRDMFATSKDRAEAIAEELKDAGKGARWLAVGEKRSHIFGWLSDYNTAIENALRLSAYKVAKDSGLSNQQAAALAKGLTVNFNKKGSAATTAGAMYAFFNAAVQGTARIAETMLEYDGPKNDPKNLRLSATGKKILMGGFALGVMQAVMGALAGWDDEEPPQFVRERNFVIPDFITGSGKYLTIPYPLGFHVIPNLGRMSTEFVMGGFKNPGKRLTDLMGVFADAFNPIGNAGLSMQTVAPTLLDPVAALTENKDWTGKRIYREDFDKAHPTPGWTRTKDTASDFSKAISYGLNYITGGGKYGIGTVSPTPDQLDYLIGQATGGVGRESLKLWQAGRSAVTGEELPMYKVPVAGRFIGETKGQASEASRFYANLERIGEHRSALKEMRDAGDSKAVIEYLRENRDAQMVKAADAASRELGYLRRQKRDAIEKGASKERIKLLEQRITARMHAFNQRVGQLEKREEGR